MKTLGPISVVLFASLLSANACSRRPPPAAIDAAPPAKEARARTLAPGEIPADLAASRVRISVIKDRDLTSPVAATLKLRDGAVTLAAPGKGQLSVDLDSIDSAVPIRNERLRNIFFETSGLGWDSAEVVVSAVPDAALAALAKDRRVANLSLAGTLSVHGRTAALAMTVDAAYTPDGRLTVTTTTPALVKISDLGLTDNLRRLSAICMHDSIDDVVRVDASLSFSPP
jgi:hypothetical protein